MTKYFIFINQRYEFITIWCSKCGSHTQQMRKVIKCLILFNFFQSKIVTNHLILSKIVKEIASITLLKGWKRNWKINRYFIKEFQWETYKLKICGANFIKICKVVKSCKKLLAASWKKIQPKNGFSFFTTLKLVGFYTKIKVKQYFVLVFDNICIILFGSKQTLNILNLVSFSTICKSLGLC